MNDDDECFVNEFFKSEIANISRFMVKTRTVAHTGFGMLLSELYSREGISTEQTKRGMMTWNAMSAEQKEPYYHKATRAFHENGQIQKQEREEFLRMDNRTQPATRAALCLMWCAKRGVLSRDTMSIIAKMTYKSRKDDIWKLVKVEEHIKRLQNKLSQKRTALGFIA